jgi:hypothetical protein
MRRAILQFGLTILCAIKLESAATQLDRTRENFSKNGIAFSFDHSYFTAAELIRRPRKVEPKNELPVDVGPPHFQISLLHAPRTSWSPDQPRYFEPSYSTIYITPLSDPVVPDFQKAYPGLFENCTRLKTLLTARPKDLDRYYEAIFKKTGKYELPHEPFNNAGAALLARARFWHVACGDGVRFLTYYQQGKTGYGATNAELLYNFQGLTSDRRYYISARFAVRHPKLPDSIDDPRAASEGSHRENRAEYERINSWKDETFFPKLTDLDQMIGSLRIK